MTVTLLQGDCREVLKTLPEKSVQCCVTSPPYFGLRRYDVEGDQIGDETSPQEYVAALVAVFREVRRVLRDDGTLWVNLGDSYAGGKQGRDDEGAADIARRAAIYGTGAPKALAKGANGVQRKPPAGMDGKQLLGIPWRVAFALQDDGWILRSDIIWAKPNCMPESVTDRPTRAHEYLFLLAKSPRYYYDAEAVAEESAPSSVARSHLVRKAAGKTVDLNRSGGNGLSHDNTRYGTGRNRRSVWTVATTPYKGAHFATFPEALIEPCILAGSRPGDTVLDPFVGSGTTCRVAEKFGRNAIGIDLGYLDLQEQRTDGVQRHMEAYL